MADELNRALETALETARGIDQEFKVVGTQLDEWLHTFRPDIFKGKSQPLDGTVEENGVYYPNPKTQQDPLQIKQWGNALRRDALLLIVDTPEITTHQLRATLSTWPEHEQLLKRYTLIFEILTQKVMDPPYYIKFFNFMCEKQAQIRNGSDKHVIDAEVEAMSKHLRNVHAS